MPPRRRAAPASPLIVYNCGAPNHVAATPKETALIRVTAHIAIDERELHWQFVRASGPGGQNVNKVATAVQLRFAALRSPALDEDLARRLLQLAGRRATANGEIVIDARRYRTQERNRQDALDRLVALIRQAAVRPAPRIPTRPTLAAKRRRLEAKRQRGTAKRSRRPVPRGDD